MRYNFFVIAALFVSACSLIRPQEPTTPPRIPQPQPGSAPNVPAAASQPPPLETAPRPAPPVKEHQLGIASKALVAQAQSQLATGDFAMAAAAMERALRIEPDNPLLWIELGKVHQASGNYSQAEHTGRKALSLATGDAKSQAAAWRLIAESLRARGRVEAAQAASARADALIAR
jgi:tetratricopeptide (TPR) repeat protein